MYVKTVQKKHRSLVRILASLIPNFLWKYILPTTPWMYVNIYVFEKIPVLRKNQLQLDDSDSIFCSFSSYFHDKMEVPQIVDSVSKKNEEREEILFYTKIKALQKELEEIKIQVAKIMDLQTKHLQNSDCRTLSTPQTFQKSCSTPLNPPPPPPPLPNFSLTSVNSPLKKVPKKKIVPNCYPCWEELLKDLKKVKLKKREKTPEGGPLKKPEKAVNNSGDFLEAVLKKRFGFIQNSPESSPESRSFTSENN